MEINNNGKIEICPRCGNVIQGYPALSRVDDQIKICSDCGAEESIIDFNFLPSLEVIDLEVLGVIIDVLAMHHRENRNNPIKSKHYNNIRERFLKKRKKLLDKLEEGGEKIR